MLNLNAKKLKRLAIVLAMVGAAMMMILTVGVFADSGDTAAAGDAAVAAAATTTGLEAIAAGIAIGLAACGGAIGMGILRCKDIRRYFKAAGSRRQDPYKLHARSRIHRDSSHLRTAHGYPDHIRSLADASADRYI